MTDLEKLTRLMGGAAKTARRLDVSLRTYWNYRAGKIPKPMQKYISITLQEEEDKTLYSGRLSNGE